MSRVDHLNELVRASAGSTSIVDAAHGWPSLVDVDVPTSGKRRIALHLSQVGTHARKAYEYRFQNPGSRSPVIAPAGAIPVLLGVWYQSGEPVFVAVDGKSRLGRETRFSILFNQKILSAAKKAGWATYVSDTGERIVAFTGANLPVFVEALVQSKNSTELDELVQDVTEDLSPGGTAAKTAEEKERRKVAAVRTIRDGAFSRKVMKAYSRQCAMCGIGSPLLQAAHLNPVSARGSDDERNGVALCANHHLLFDAHLITIDAKTFKVHFSPSLLSAAKNDAAMQAFIKLTFTHITKSKSGYPDSKMLDMRHGHFMSAYEWLA